MRILVSGASIAGPVVAYWLTRYGHEVTVVERSPVLRKTGGHAVDLMKPAMDISERMGVLPRIEAKPTGTERLTMQREGTGKRASADATKIFAAASDRHVEIMRDDLSEIYYDATLPGVTYVFGDSITSIDPDSGDVTFETGAPRRFDLVIGADGLHSNVRRLVFGEVEKVFVGAYLAVLSVPRELGVPGEMVGHIGPGRTAAVYGTRHIDDARAVFLFRSEELTYHHRDVARQKELLRTAFAGLHPEVDSWLSHLDSGSAFYFDSITQLRNDTWSRGRVALVGDAGYCPGPAVGGSTSLAVIGAYVLAGELASGDDFAAAFARYEERMRGIVQESRAFALGAAKALIPATSAGVWALMRGMQVFTALPTWLTRPLAKLNTKGLRLHDSMVVPDYERQGADVPAP